MTWKLDPKPWWICATRLPITRLMFKRCINENSIGMPLWNFMGSDLRSYENIVQLYTIYAKCCLLKGPWTPINSNGQNQQLKPEDLTSLNEASRRLPKPSSSRSTWCIYASTVPGFPKQPWSRTNSRSFTLQWIIPMKSNEVMCIQCSTNIFPCEWFLISSQLLSRTILKPEKKEKPYWS